MTTLQFKLGIFSLFLVFMIGCIACHPINSDPDVTPLRQFACKAEQDLANAIAPVLAVYTQSRNPACFQTILMNAFASAGFNMCTVGGGLVASIACPSIAQAIVSKVGSKLPAECGANPTIDPGTMGDAINQYCQNIINF